MLDRLKAFFIGTTEPTTIAAPAATEAGPDVAALQQKIGTLRAQVEGLLDQLDDVDARVPGQEQALFRDLNVGAEVGDRDLPLAKMWDVLRMAHKVYALRGTGHNIVEIFIDFIVGNGIRPVAKDSKNKVLQEALDAIWKDPVNKLDRKHEEFVRTLLLEGERLFAVDLVEVDGRLELGYLRPEKVKRVVKTGRDLDVFVHYENPSPGGQPLEYFILDTWLPTIEIRRTGNAADNQRYVITETILGGAAGPSVTPRTVHGLAFTWFNGRPEGATRGRSELLEILDYVDIHDELLWTMLERDKLQRMFLLWLSSNSITDAASANQKLRELGLHVAPTGPKVVATGMNDKLELFSSDRIATASRDNERTAALNIYGSKGFPEHWSGSGADTNLATAQAQGTVPQRRLARKQGFVLGLFHALVATMLRFRVIAKTLPEGTDLEFEWEKTEVGGKDKTQATAALRDLALALSQAVSDSFLSRQAANAVFVQTVRGAGFELTDDEAGIPTDAELARMQAHQDRLARATAGDGGQGQAPGGSPQDGGGE